MCGRLVLSSEPRQLSLVFDAELDADVDPCACVGYNVPPTSRVLGVVAVPAHRPDPARSLGWFRWGLAYGGRRPTPGRPPAGLFNARGEMVGDKPAFRAAFASRRCLVVADGFYEWRVGPGRQRQPFYFHRADGRPLALAGVWERGPGSTARSCAIITTAANDDMGGIHDRMPVVLEPGGFDGWLDPTNRDRGELDAMVRPGPVGTLAHHPVGSRVGDVGNDDPTLVERIEPVVPATLFG